MTERSDSESGCGGMVVHLKREPFDVRIDRATAWGNPFVLGHDGDREEVLVKYRNWVTTSEDRSAVWVRENVHRLKGKTLGCWCAPLGGASLDDAPWVCHGQVLLLMASSPI